MMMARKFAFIRLKITRDAIVSQFQGQNPSRYLISSPVEVSYEHQHNYDIPITNGKSSKIQSNDYEI